MPITYPLDPPSGAPVSLRVSMTDVIGLSRSPFTLQAEVFAHHGAMWRATIELPPLMGRAHADAWRAWLAALRGRLGTFRMSLDGITPRGTAGGTPLVDGAGQSGLTLATDGWPVSTAGVLRAGDMIEVGERLYMITADASSNASGQATLDLWPRLRSSPADNAPVTTSQPRGLWRLASNERAYDVRPGLEYMVTIEAEEAL